MRHKQFEIIETKADGGKGEFTAIVAAFGNVDRGGDRIMSGAFTKTLEKWVKSGDPIPIILSHQWNDPMAHIGVVDPRNVKQVPKGLMFQKAQLDIEDNPIAAQVFKLMKRRSLKEFSIGFGVPDDGEAVNEKDGANEIHEIDLVEAGPTLKGMNDQTELLKIKSALGADEKAEPPSEAELRRATAQLDRDAEAARLPDVQAKATEPEEPPKVEGPKSPPASAAELRRASDRLERGKIKEQLPDTPGVQPAPSPVAQLETRLAATEKELADVKEAQKVPRLSEKDLRRATDRLERDKQKGTLVESADPPAASPVADLLVEMSRMASELKAVNERLDAAEKTPPADEGTLRRASAKLERERTEADLPDPKVDPAPDPVKVMGADLDRLRSEVVRLVKVHSVGRAYEGKQLASDLRMKLEAVGQERFGSTNTYAYVDDFDPDRGWVIFCVFSEGTPARFIQVEYTKESDGVALSTEETEVVRSTTYQPLNQPKAVAAVRPADPLRQRSDQTVLEIQSGGASLRKPPPIPKDVPEPVLDEQELRQRSYEVTLALLTEGTA